MHLGCCSTFGKRNSRNHATDIISLHPACMDHAILHGKPFINPLSIYWSILSRASSIKAGGNSCNLCLEEKLQILRNCNSCMSCLNKRSELFTKCVHARKFYAGRFKRTRVSKHTANVVK